MSTSQQPFIRWLLGLLLGAAEGVRKHISTLFAMSLIYALGVQASAPEWAANAIVLALGVGTATNVGEWAFKKMRSPSQTPTPAAAAPSPHPPVAAGDGASAS